MTMKFVEWIGFLIFNFFGRAVTQDVTLASHLKETWIKHKENVSLVFSDAHLAAYFDPDVDTSIVWPFSPLSKTWKYVKDTYGSFGEDPHLFLILHSKKHSGCTSISFRSNAAQSRNVIDCGILRKDEKFNDWTETAENFEAILMALRNLITNGARGERNDADLNVSRGVMTDIITYDILLHQEDQRWNLTAQWKMSKLNFSFDNMFWFRDWYLPIYERYGGGSVLNNYYSYTNLHWVGYQKRNNRYMNFGEFVHFWSQAASVDLEPLAQIAGISLKPDFALQLTAARAKFAAFNYSASTSTENLPAENPPGKWQLYRNKSVTLAYFDDHVAFYNKHIFQLHPISSFKFVSAAWKYARDIYSQSFEGDYQLLYIAFDNGTADECFSRNTDRQKERRKIMMQCRIDNDFFVPTEKIVTEIALIALDLKFRNTTETAQEHWPGFNVSDSTISSIFVYDMYLSLGRADDARRWKQVNANVSMPFPQNGTFWFRDWYLKIYENQDYGSSATTVIKNFFQLLYTHLPKLQNGGRIRQLNIGEFVHFWSGAANANLKDLALDAFGWNELNDDQLLHARVEYYNITYPIEESNETIPKRFILLDLPRTPTLKLVYKDGHVGIYYDPNVESSSKVTWPFRPLSKSWRHLKDSYPNVLDLSKKYPHLYILFRVKPRKECEHISTLSIQTDTGPKEIHNIIDCGYTQEYPWVKYDAPENVESLMKVFENLLLAQMGISVNEDFETNNFNLTTKSIAFVIKLIIYDLYRNQRRLYEADRWLLNVEGRQISSHSNKDWLTDWYLPIYDYPQDDQGNYQDGASVLNRFIAILNSTKERRMIDRDGVLQVGEFVHLWSGAARRDLRELAAKAFGWGQEYQDEFNKAREDYVALNYTCNRCDKLPGTPIDSSEGEQTTLLIATITVIVLVVIIILWIQICCIARRKKMELMTRKLTPDEESDFLRGSTALRASENAYANVDDANSPIYAMPFNKSYEIDKDRLVINTTSELGKGAFGIVKKGLIKGRREDGTNDIIVAVKTVNRNVDVDIFKALLSEIKIMAYIGPHENIVSLRGTVTTNIKNLEVYAALEFCPKKDLRRYLKENRNVFLDLWKKNSPVCRFTKGNEPFVEFESNQTLLGNDYDYATPSISTLNLLRWARQIANGMVFLSGRNVIHGDLAARNILLSADGVAKISDFGLSRQLVNYANYVKQSSTPMPWRWMAIESLTDRRFSVYSDIWSYGVTLWEIFTLSKVPFENRIWDSDFTEFLASGKHLDPPDFANPKVFKCMRDCWKLVPKERTSFPEIIDTLDSVLATFDSDGPSTSRGPNCYFEME